MDLGREHGVLPVAQKGQEMAFSPFFDSLTPFLTNCSRNF